MTKKTSAIIAGICFIVYSGQADGLWVSLALSDLSFKLGITYIGYIAYLVIGIGLLIDKPIISAVGGGISAVCYLVRLISGPVTLYISLLLASSVVLIVLCFVRQAARVLGIVGAILSAFVEIRSVILTVSRSNLKYSLLEIAEIPLLIGLFLIGFAFYQKKRTIPENRYSPAEESISSNHGPIYCSNNEKKELTSVKRIRIPTEQRKRTTLASNLYYDTLEIYDNRVVGYLGGNQTMTWYFKEYSGIDFIRANMNSQFAQVVFLTGMNAKNRAVGPDFGAMQNLNAMNDTNRILFCSGMFSFSNTNDFASSVASEIRRAFEDYKNNDAIEVSGAVGVSAADEIKKFKELLDMGIITQEEFDAKKKQLLRL